VTQLTLRGIMEGLLADTAAPVIHRMIVTDGETGAGLTHGHALAPAPSPRGRGAGCRRHKRETFAGFHP
jgi:hypothetical protein